MARKLSVQQESYVDLRISGVEPIDAYRKCYNSKKSNPKTQSNEAHKLEKHPVISLLILEGREKVAERALITAEDVVRGLMAEAADSGEGTSQSARVSAWKALSDYTGKFDANRIKVDARVTEVSQEEWLAGLK